MSATNYLTERSARRAVAMERRERVAKLLLQRVPQREIAELEEVALGTVCQDVAAIKATWRKETAQHYDEIVDRESAKLDQLDAAFAPAAFDGDVKAAEMVLKIADRRARLLGLDRPQRVEHTGADGGPIEVVSLDELAAQAEADVIFLAEHRKADTA